jgi:tetratricopeptide (TPR) repeat protein
LKEYQRALADFERVIQLEPENALAYNYRGISYSALGQHERALADFDHAMQLDPNLARAYLNKGAALAKIGQRDEALKYGEKAMSLGALGASQFVSVLRGEYRPGRRRPWRLW